MSTFFQQAAKNGKDGMGKGKRDGEGLVWSKLCVEE